jgi:Zn-dependent protease
VLFTLAQPATFVALLLAFLAAILLRAVAIRLAGRRLGLAGRGEPLIDLRHDIDPFGAVGAAVCGIGWGKMISVDEVPRWQGRGRAALLFLAGPLTCIVTGEILLAVNAVLYGGRALELLGAGHILGGLAHVVTSTGQEMLLAFAVGILAFGLLALVPIPPLDGFGVLYFALRRPGAGIQWMRLWFEEKNIGLVVLMALCLIPFGGPYLILLIDLLATPLVSPWAAV